MNTTECVNDCGSFFERVCMYKTVSSSALCPPLSLLTLTAALPRQVAERLQDVRGSTDGRNTAEKQRQLPLELHRRNTGNRQNDREWLSE